MYVYIYIYTYFCWGDRRREDGQAPNARSGKRNPAVMGRRVAPLVVCDSHSELWDFELWTPAVWGQGGGRRRMGMGEYAQSPY